jgi:hypothetical protein
VFELWTYQGRTVIVPRSADIPWNFLHNPEFRQLVQDALDDSMDAVPPWRPGKNLIFTAKTEVPIDCLVVEVGKLPVSWFKHIGHKARNVQYSPFVMLKRPPTTKQLTIELKGLPRNPWLVRAYPGGYTPPLPWQVTAGDAPGGRARCVQFWRCHAYIYRESRVRPNDRAKRAPHWFTARGIQTLSRAV